MSTLKESYVVFYLFVNIERLNLIENAFALCI